MSNDVEKRKKAVINWLKKPTNLLLIAIILFAFFVRLYYFDITVDQALWWDEAEYMSAAKMWAFNVPYEMNPQRPPLFQAIAALIFILGLGEVFIKFTLTLLPSVFLIYAVYLLGKEMYNNKIGLIAAFLTAVNWSLLFWSMRVQPDFISMSFQVLAVLFMWKYWKSDKTKLIVWAGVFTALGFYFKVSALLVPMTFIVFIFLKDRFEAIKKKDYYIYSASFLLTLVPYFVWSWFKYGTFTAFKSGYSNAIGTPTPFGWYNFNFYYSLTEGILFALFIFGVILALKFLLYSDLLVKDKKKCFDSGLFSVLILLVVSAFYIFYIRFTDDRWVFLWLPFIFFLIGDALMFIYNKLKKYNKILAILVFLGLLISGGYMHLTHADNVINMKKDSYMPVKLGSLWIKENSEPGDVIMSVSSTQATYYTERNVTQTNHLEGVEEFEENIINTRPKYIMISIFEPHKPWISEWIDSNNDKVEVSKVYFADKEQTRPILIVYRFKHEKIY